MRGNARSALSLAEPFLAMARMLLFVPLSAKKAKKVPWKQPAGGVQARAGWTTLEVRHGGGGRDSLTADFATGGCGLKRVASSRTARTFAFVATNLRPQTGLPCIS